MSIHYRYRLSRYIKNHAEQLNPDLKEALLYQFKPSELEQNSANDFIEDPLSEEDPDIKPLPFAIHKYPSKLLLLTTNECPVFCRYCTRKRKTLKDQHTEELDYEALKDYLSSHPEINEIILSGGDPLMLSTGKLMNLLYFLSNQSSINFVRIHTRTATTLPTRWNTELRTALHNYSENNPRGFLTVVHHINTVQEITPKAESVFQFLRQNEIRQLNQSVLLAKVNDSSEKLEKLILKLSSCGISPYYLHQLDKVEGASHFEVEQTIGLQIITELKKRLPGHLVPRYVRDTKYGKSSIPGLAPAAPE